MPPRTTFTPTTAQGAAIARLADALNDPAQSPTQQSKAWAWAADEIQWAIAGLEGRTETETGPPRIPRRPENRDGERRERRRI